MNTYTEPEAIFPECIDNSLLKEFRVCPQRALRGRLQGLRPLEGLSIDLHFGSAYALGCEITRKAFYVEGCNAERSLARGVEAAMRHFQSTLVVIPSRSNKTIYNLIAALQSAFENWELGNDGLTPIEGGIEMYFEKELPIRHPETGKPLKYSGKCDMVARNEYGGIVVVDDKTTGYFSDTWLMNWDTDPQLTGYIWQAGDFACGPDAAHGVIRGTAITAKSITHTIVPVFRTEHQLNMWYEQMLADVKAMLKMYETYQNSVESRSDAWPRRFGEACVRYGRQCEYAVLCNSPNPQTFIQQNFKVEFWNPKPLASDTINGQCLEGF